MELQQTQICFVCNDPNLNSVKTKVDLLPYVIQSNSTIHHAALVIINTDVF